MLHFAVFILMGLVPYIVLWFYVWFQSGICSLGAYVFCTVSDVNSAMLVKPSFGRGFSLLEKWKPFLATEGSPKILLCIPYSMWMYVLTLISVRLWNFKDGGSEKRFLVKNQHTKRKINLLMNVSLSKIWHLENRLLHRSLYAFTAM